jgi:hypothetical protein
MSTEYEVFEDALKRVLTAKKSVSASERCEGITATGNQCRCWATERINAIPYCRQHAAKELRAVARDETKRMV